VHQVIDARIDRPLQLGASFGGFWWESIEQLHVLLDQPSIVRASELPGRNGQHCAAKNRRTVQRDLSQTSQVHSFYGSTSAR
jgi:cytidylate kinase